MNTFGGVVRKCNEHICGAFALKVKGGIASVTISLEVALHYVLGYLYLSIRSYQMCFGMSAV